MKNYHSWDPMGKTTNPHARSDSWKECESGCKKEKRWSHAATSKSSVDWGMRPPHYLVNTTANKQVDDATDKDDHKAAITLRTMLTMTPVHWVKRLSDRWRRDDRWRKQSRFNFGHWKDLLQQWELRQHLPTCLSPRRSTTSQSYTNLLPC